MRAEGREDRVPTVDGADPVDRPALLRRLGGDEELCARVTQLFLEDCPARLAELADALSSGDTDRVRLVAHAIKGVAGNLSARRLLEAAGELERVAAAGLVDRLAKAARLVTCEAERVMSCFQTESGPAAGAQQERR